jgi:AraC-like DNA-binding protein
MPISIIINNYHFSMLGLLILNSLALLVLPIEIIYITIKSRIREAVILTISFSLLLWGSLTYLMKSLGIIEENVITKYSMYLGSIAHVLLLSFGLTDKIETLRDELQHLNVRLSKLDTDGKKRIISYANREKLKKAIIYIEENYHDDITREGLASFIEMNCDDFGRYFKLYTGMKINEYIYELRINEAARRIRETDESITEISFSVGFESFNTFKRAFYKIQNLSPIKYKKLHIADNKHDDLETKEPPQPVP